MKKILIVSSLCLISFSAQAQMGDVLGAIAIDGELTRESYQSVGNAQQALNRMQFQQDLSSLVSSIQMTFMGNYAGIDKSALGFEGFKKVDWNVGSVSGNDFYVEFNNLDGATCFLCTGNAWGAKSVEISGGSCQGSSNRVKMSF